jgi:phytoene synthase
LLLPPDKRQALWAAYAFFRKIDDLVDLHGAGPDEIEAWRAQALRPAECQTDPLLAAWADVRRRYGIDDRYVNELLIGIAQDAARTRFATVSDLLHYCYQVASCPALLMIPIIGLAPGVTAQMAEPYAARLGQALQLSDLLSDLYEDTGGGRVYLPHDLLRRYGVSEEQILNRRFDQRVANLVRHVMELADDLYREAWPGFALLSLTGRAAASSGALLVRAQLDVIRRRHYDSLTRPITVSPWRRWASLVRSWPGVVINPPRPA